ncbi:MAG TPA: hypothetical protein VG963_30540, partial [Polyangiaceae bacterium]|nr:hypothetical protein [Polyangiaceae bacterium]
MTTLSLQLRGSFSRESWRSRARKRRHEGRYEWLLAVAGVLGAIACSSGGSQLGSRRLPAPSGAPDPNQLVGPGGDDPSATPPDTVPLGP